MVRLPKKKNIEYKNVFWFSIQRLYETLLNPRRNEREIWWTMYTVFTQSIRYSCQILLNSNFLDRFWKNTQMSNFIKIRPVWAEVFHAEGLMEGQTDMTKLVVVLYNFANAPTNLFLLLQWIWSAWSRPARRDNRSLEAVGSSDYFFLIVVCSPFTRRVPEVKLLFKKSFHYV